MIPNEADLGRWRSELAQVSPPTDQLSYLHLRWEPGDPWIPVERWVLWHLIPIERTNEAILEELRGPHPRSSGHMCMTGMCPCEIKANRWVGGPCTLIDLGTWELFRETGRYGRRWWTVQGTKGGHRYRLSEAERVVWRTLTGTEDTPAPGDLPYAPFDNRVIAHLRGKDNMTRQLAVMSYGMKNLHHLDAEEKMEVSMAKRAVADWLAGQMEEITDEYGPLLKRMTEDFQPTRMDPLIEQSLHDDYHLT